MHSISFYKYYCGDLLVRRGIALILKVVVILAVVMPFPPVWAQESPSSIPAAAPSTIPATPQVQPPQLPASKGPPPGMAPQSTAPQSTGPQPTAPRSVIPPGSPSPANEGQIVSSPAVMPPVSHPFIQQQRSTINGGQVTLNFDDADVYEVIQTIFGQILRVNYVVDPRVKGRVTFRSITPVARENVLPTMEVILRLNNIAVVEESNLYRIVPIGDIAKEPARVQLGRDSKSIPSTGKALLQVVPIRYMQSSDVVKLVTPFLSANAVVIDVPKSNQIIMVDTDANVKRLLGLVEIFDNEQQKKKGPQVFVYHVQNGKAKEIAVQLQQIFLTGKSSSGEKATTVVTAPQSQSRSALPSQPMSVPQSTQPGSREPYGGEALVSDITRIFSDETLNAVIVLSTPEDYEIIKDAIVKIDLVPRQVMIEGMIASVILTDNLSLGLAWSIKTNVFGLASTIALNPASLNPTKIPGTGLNLVGTDSKGDIRDIISALASQSKAKLLAAPHILVSDNQEARIQVGQQVPLVTSETFGSTTIAPQRTIQYRDIGIILKVKPQVNDSGLVSLEIKQEVSTFETIPLTLTTQDIIINKTEASTNLVVQDGHTIIIGGLIREDKTKSLNGIPWLSKIPIIGSLFGNTIDNETRTEIIILLTPHVVKSQKEAKDLTSDYINKFTDTGKGGITNEELLKKGKLGGSSKNSQTINPLP